MHGATLGDVPKPFPLGVLEVAGHLDIAIDLIERLSASRRMYVRTLAG